MKHFFYKGRFIFIPIAAAAFLSLVSFVVMQLWNNLLPAILHVSVITFWQAIGIFILCKILFGFGKGGHKGGPGRFMRFKMEERMKHMTPEEKEKFKAQMHDRMCNWRRGDRGHDHPFSRDWGKFAGEPVEPTE